MASPVRNLPPPKNQSGAVLVIGLVFLVLLTMLGITTMQATTMEEKMAGHARDRSLAFQAAESGLRDAEQFLIGKDFYAFNVNCSGGLCGQGSVPSWKTYAWDGSKDVSATTGISGVAEQPRYFSEYAGQVKCPECGGGWSSVYRITVRGKGSNGNTLMFLQQVQRP